MQLAAKVSPLMGSYFFFFHVMSPSVDTLHEDTDGSFLISSMHDSDRMNKTNPGHSDADHHDLRTIIPILGLQRLCAAAPCPRR